MDQVREIYSRLDDYGLDTADQAIESALRNTCSKVCILGQASEGKVTVLRVDSDSHLLGFIRYVQKLGGGSIGTPTCRGKQILQIFSKQGNGLVWRISGYFCALGCIEHSITTCRTVICIAWNAVVSLGLGSCGQSLHRPAHRT